MLQKAYVHVIFFLVLWLDLPSVGLALNLSFILYKSVQTNFATDTPLAERHLLQGQPTVSTGMLLRLPEGTRIHTGSKKRTKH